MMSITHWQPSIELMSLRWAMDKLFEDSAVSPSRIWGAFGPGVTTSVDMYHTEAEEEVKREDYLYQEHRYGAFSHSVTLPSGLNTDEAEATFDDGILTLNIPKAEKVKPKQIKVKAKGVIEGKK